MTMPGSQICGRAARNESASFRGRNKGIDFPNFHYIKMTVAGGRLRGEIFRLDEPTAPSPHFTMKDAFEVAVHPSRTKNQ
jgi:hypothetical protein